MHRSSVLALVLGAACLAPCGVRSAAGGDDPAPGHVCPLPTGGLPLPTGGLPAPTHRAIDAGTPAGPIDRVVPARWPPPADVPRATVPEFAGDLVPERVPPPPAPAAPFAPDDGSGDDQGVPRLSRQGTRRGDESAPPEFDPTTWDPKLPPLGHPIKARSRISLETDPEMHGTVEMFPVDDATVALVMVGNPVVRGDDFLIKAETLVVWIDKKAQGGVLGFGASPLAGPATSGAAKAGAAPGSDARPADAKGGAGAASTSVMPEAVIAIYAEGSVDLVSGDLAFRASELYVNDRRRRALLIEPRFDASTMVGGTTKPIPVHVRAATMRTLAEGYSAFEDAEVSTARSNDHIGLEIRVLTVEEFGKAVPGKPTLLGFNVNTGSAPRFSSQSIVGRAERVPIFYVPDASFGGENGLADFPVRIRHLTAGSRSSFGRWGFLGVGARKEVGDHAYVDWTANAVGYTKRGLGLGEELEWKALGSAPGGRSALAGRLESFGLYDLTGEDRNGYRAGEGFRGKIELENRWEASPTLRLDTEANGFTDRGFNREFFESDDKNHKDRETYARLRWMQGGTAMTLMEGFHARDFVTESISEPTLALWSESLPLGETSGPVHLAFDLSSAATVSRLARRFDTQASETDYAATRADVTERVYAPFDLGDVRISPFVGVNWTGYYDRDDGGPDVSRTALEAGVRANLQLHRDYDALGGRWRLDGLRHVIDLDAGAYARAFDDVAPDEVPYFDGVDQLEDRNELYLEMRQRLETRRVTGDRTVGHERRSATLADLRIKASFWPDRIGPYERRGPGQLEVWGMAEIVPGQAWLKGESVASFEGATFQHSSIGVQWAPSDVLGAAVGVRHVHQEELAPWIDVYGRWNEKWGGRFSAIRNFDSSHGADFRIAVLRFSEDHQVGFGVNVRDDGRDIGVFFSYNPAIGGELIGSPFDPREAVDFNP